MNALPEPPADEFTTHSAACKLCRRPLLLKFHVECPPTRVECWKPMATCDKCFDYVDKLRVMNQRIDRTTRRFYDLHHVDDSNEHAVEAAQAIGQRLRIKLSALTKLYAQHVCRHWDKPVFWEPDFVDQLVENPLSAGKILALYVRMVRRT